VLTGQLLSNQSFLGVTRGLPVSAVAGGTACASAPVRFFRANAAPNAPAPTPSLERNHRRASAICEVSALIVPRLAGQRPRLNLATLARAAVTRPCHFLSASSPVSWPSQEPLFIPQIGHGTLLRYKLNATDSPARMTMVTAGMCRAILCRCRAGRFAPVERSAGGAFGFSQIRPAKPRG